MRKPEIKKFVINGEKKDKILIVDNMLTVNRNSRRDNFDLNLLQEVDSSWKPWEKTVNGNLGSVTFSSPKGYFTLLIGNRSISIKYDSSDLEAIKELDSFLTPLANPDSYEFDGIFNDTRENKNPKGFKRKKNQLDFYRIKVPEKEIVDRNTVVFEPSTQSRIIVLGNLINVEVPEGSNTYDLNKLIEFERDDRNFKIKFGYQKSAIKEIEIEFGDSGLLSDQFEDFLEYWKERNTFGK